MRGVRLRKREKQVSANHTASECTPRTAVAGRYDSSAGGRHRHRGCGARARIYILDLPSVTGTTTLSTRMFDDVRQAFRDLLRGTPPSGDARRSILAQMRETLVQARMGLDDLRKGAEETRARLKRERMELDTVRRRKELAQGINDGETVTIAERYEKQHSERVALLERKLETQEAELAMVEREVVEMNAEFKLAAAGATPGVAAGSPSSSDVDAAVNEAMGDNAGLRDEIDGMARARRRADAEASAEEKLAALKRRMGK